MGLMLNEAEPGSWPAFYEAGPGNILWIVGGSVRNGGWKPTFSKDRLTCWHEPSYIFKWVAKAPYDGNYNDVIDSFRQSRSGGSNG